MAILQVFALFICCLTFQATAQEAKLTDSKTFKFQTGDLLFQDLDCGGLCTAIETVTEGVDGKSFSHLGLVHIYNDSIVVIEAIGKNVQVTPIKVFVNRNLDEVGNPKVIVTRLVDDNAFFTKKTLDFAVAQLGMPYDDAFLYDNGSYYCSELIYDAFKAANDDQPFFELTPMTFKDPATNEMFPVWVEYYAELGIPIPEGELGCNPGGISRSEKLKVVASFY
ncbi:MAG: hypothetical protein K9G46_14100 [Flavobacteriales bacterium]|jgi:uncharacterized protein YycO|nr:hypothetical protein [Flavobacteriales bacterium]